MVPRSAKIRSSVFREEKIMNTRGRTATQAATVSPMYVNALTRALLAARPRPFSTCGAFPDVAAVISVLLPGEPALDK